MRSGQPREKTIRGKVACCKRENETILCLTLTFKDYIGATSYEDKLATQYQMRI